MILLLAWLVIPLGLDLWAVNCSTIVAYRV